jgi:di/tripeptidase
LARKIKNNKNPHNEKNPLRDGVLELESPVGTIEKAKKLFDIYRQESKFWFSKAHQKAYATSVVNGELDKAIKQDEQEYQEKLKAEKGKFKLNK